MKHLYALLFLFLFLACNPSDDAFMADYEEPKPPAYYPHGVTYEIFVQSWADTNKDGIGDFQGVIQSLDYLEDLGVEAIWFMPIHPSPSYHKYDVTDYYDVHPDYGSMDDFRELVEEAHKRDIHIIMDLVVNHSSNQHPWFIEAAKGTTNPFRDYYVWANRDSIADEIAKKEITLDSDNIRQWHPNGNDSEHYYGFFTGEMPDLNFDNPELRQEIYKIGRFWLEEIGVDGFRLDAAKHIYPDDQPEDNHAFWAEFRQEMEKVKPDVYLVGEIWGQKELLAPYFKGLQAVFNFDWWFAMNDLFNERGVKDFAQNHQEARKLYAQFRPDFIDPIFLGNHDQNRILSVLEGDTAQQKLALALLMTSPGAPYLYYGEEIGMLGAKPDPNIREPFLWDQKERDSLRTRWINPVYSTDKTVVPLAQQMQDFNSLYHYYRYWIHLRRWQPVLAMGEIRPIDADHPHVLAFRREFDGEVLEVYHNFGGDTLQLEVPSGMVPLAVNKAHLNGRVLTLRAFGSAVLEPLSE
jgi:glycosidase